MSRSLQTRRRAQLAVLVVLSLGTLVVCPFLGMKTLSFSALSSTLPEAAIDHDILMQIRIPRVLTAWLAGAALALSGMVFQAVFRNPLATPYTLGVSGGASLGASIWIRLGLTGAILGFAGVSIGALLGALGAVSLVYGLTRLRGGFSSTTLLLAGVAVGFFFSSLIMLIQYASGLTHSFRIMRWMMGSLEVAGWEPVRHLAVCLAVAGIPVALLTRELNLLLTGEDLAASRGANVDALKKGLFVCTSIMVGAVVAFCGPIGFVGMIVPHICRLLVGSEHRTLMPAALFGGGLFLAVCDTFARTVLAPAEIPVGVITSLIGGPFFVWLLLNRKGKLEM